MEIRNPEYLVEIARQKGITRAAEKLFVTQSTLSQYLLKLEAEVGTPLFLRDQGHLALTDAGRVYVAAAEDILRIQRAAADSVEALRGRGHIDVGVTSAWGTALLADVLPDFRREYPAVTLRITENRSYRQIKAILRAGKVDLAVMAVTPDDDVPAQGYTHLRWEEIALVLPADHPFCRTHREETISPKMLPGELRQEPFLLSCRDSSIRQMEESLFTKLMFHPNGICELNSNDIALRMIAGGAGAALLPLAYARAAEGVRAYRLDPPMLRRDELALRKSAERTPALDFLIRRIESDARFRSQS